MNVPSYFIIVLGGFAVVWGFRWKQDSQEPLGEFEYAAWSAIWGSLYILMLLNITTYFFHWPSDNTFNNFLEVPFIISPTLVLIGLPVGIVSSWVFSHCMKLKGS